MLGKTIVIALGGNALIPKGAWGTVKDQKKRIDETAEIVAQLARKGYKVILTHGNGPQVGNLLLQQEYARTVVPDMPLDVLVAETQGQIGYLLQQSIENALRNHRMHKGVLSLVTQVVVDEYDSSFKDPSKPVGPYYMVKEALELKKKFTLANDAGKGYRRVVASPKPLRIVEASSIKKLASDGFIVIACGGGGIPVIEKAGKYWGVEAVIDKDYASVLLAKEVGAELLVMLTDVEYAFINYNARQKEPLPIRKIDAHRASILLGQGQFGEGSMKPKMDSGIDFVAKYKGSKAIITTPEKLFQALDGKTGTIITKERKG